MRTDANLTLCAPSVLFGNSGLGGIYSATLKNKEINKQRE